MSKKLSISTGKKDFIRFVWFRYIKKYLEKYDDEENQEIKVVTLTTEKLLDVKKFLEIENITLDNLYCITVQSHVREEFKELLNIYGKDYKKIGQYFDTRYIEQILSDGGFKDYINIYNLDYSNCFFYKKSIFSIFK